MTPEVIGIGVTVLLAIIGFSVYCGKTKQQVDDHEKEIVEAKAEASKIKDSLASAIKEQSKEFTEVLKAHTDSEQMREAKVEAIKDELQKQIRDMIKHESDLRYNKEETKQLKKDVVSLKDEMDGIRETTNDIKQDIVKLFAILGQLIENTKEIGLSVKEIAKQGNSRESN